MKRQIYIHLGDPTLSGVMPEQVYWFVKDQDGSAAPVYHGDLKTASNHALGCRVVILVSGVEVVLTDVALPGMNRQKLLKAIPFALEEQLASDVDDNHFAVGERQQGEDKVNVAIVERNIIEMWLQGLKDVGIQPDVLTTEVLSVPHADDTWTLLLKSADKQSKSKAILRNNVQSGIALDLANVEPLLNSMLESTSEGRRPARLKVITCDSASSDAEVSPDDQQATPRRVSAQMSAIAAQLEAVGSKFGIDVEVEHAEQSFLMYLANQFEESKSINLLQGDYSRREQLEKLLRPWLPAASIAVIWLLLHFGLMVFDYQKLASKDRELRAKVTQIFREAFPDAKNIVDPKLQMEQKLAELRQQANQSADMFVLLSRAGDVLGDTDSLLIRTMRFKDETLDLDVDISDLQALDQLKVRLTNEANLVVDIQSASSKKGKVESRVQLKAASEPAAGQSSRSGA